MTADLHCHSTVSDGSTPPRLLPALAARMGLGCIAVTDHDCLDGGRQAVSAAVPGVRVIDGVELSTRDRRSGRRVHLLCYHPLKTAELERFCRRTLLERRRVAEQIVGRLRTRYPIDIGLVEDCARGSATLYKQHIAVALMRMGYTLSVFGELFQKALSRQGWACVEPDYPETREALEIALESGGVCVLAHPGLYGNFELLPELAAMGLHGVEAHHPRQSGEDCLRAQRMARQLHLITTGGSDFHGAYASRPTPMGMRVTDGGELRAFDRLLASRAAGGK